MTRFAFSKDECAKDTEEVTMAVTPGASPGAAARAEPTAGTLEARIRSGLGGRSIVLVGMPGCGKSALGKRLAPRLGLPFVDVDDEIERAAGKSIREIFADHGEADFRDGERKVIARLLAAGPQVLATGGGALINAETRDNIKREGISIWVKADAALLVRRVAKRNTRPLFEGRDPEVVVKELMDARSPLYATADIVVESRDVPHDAMVDELVAALAACPLLAAPAAADPGASQP
ncbi:MAG TPA: shikimate kinase [Hyphomicrobiaceae bacterium]|nr:shikimate kinase [Hyphomicrobiaceae bacterium]